MNMEDKLKNYENFIRKAANQPTPELAEYHAQMVKNFQHERAIHLAVTLFFVAMAVVLLALSMWLITLTQNPIVVAPSLSAAGIMIILSIFYVRHYYFLENHIQTLYDYTKKIYDGLERQKNETLVDKITNTVEKLFDK